MQYLDQDENESNNLKQEFVRADSPINSNMGDEDECDPSSSIDEFKESIKKVEQRQQLSKVQANQQVAAQQYPNQSGITGQAYGHTQMNKDVYKKESKENCLQKRKSQDLIGLQGISNAPSQHDIQVKQNNIIIDLTNQLYEENKNSNYNSSQFQRQQEQLNLIPQVLSQIPKEIVTQKDIDEFKKQIQQDLQKLTQVLEQTTKKQFENQQLEQQLKQQMLIEEAEKVKKQIQAEVQHDNISASQIYEINSQMVQNDNQSDLSFIKNEINMTEQKHVKKAQTHQNIEYQQLQKQIDLQQKPDIAQNQKIGKSLAKDFKQSSKGPQSNIQPQKGLNQSNHSVKSGNSSMMNSKLNIRNQKGSENNVSTSHQRLKSANNNIQQNHFYLNLNSLQNNQNQTTKNTQAMYTTGFRNQATVNNMRSNSREKKGTQSNYNTKSPQSYSSVSYSMKSRSGVKNSAAIQKSGQRNQSKNGSYVIMEEEPNQDTSVMNQIITENEDLKQQIHQLRLKNAEHRTEIQKVKRENQDALIQNSALEEKIRAQDKQRKKDCDYILKQETEIEKLIENKLQTSNLSKVQEDQIANLKNMLNQTINVKIKYENIIKKLIESDKTREQVLSVIEQVQQQQQVSFQQPYDQTQQFNASFFNSSAQFSQLKSATNQSYAPSLNATQNVSQLLAQAAKRVLGNSQKMAFNKNFETFKPQQDIDDQEEYQDEEEQEYGQQHQEQIQEEESDDDDEQQNQFQIEDNEQASQSSQIAKYSQRINGQEISGQFNCGHHEAGGSSGSQKTKLNLFEMPM